MKFLVIRFSSIGDATQALSIPQHVKNTYPNASVDFLTKKEFEKIFVFSPSIHKLWTIEKKMSLFQLFQFARQLSNQNYTHLYDAHNNLRSNLFYIFVRAQNKLQRPMMRWKRFLLLNFKINLFEKPFSGQRDLLKPLEKWAIPFSLPPAPQLFLDPKDQKKAAEIIEKFQLKDFIILVPSAAHALKRWPILHWEKLIKLNPLQKFVILAGPQDDFTKDLDHCENVINLTGQTSLSESAAIIQLSKAVITNDTGLLHFSEQLGKPAIALMGPAPFGFPSRPSTVILERHLKCRPCSKHGQGPCTNKFYHECMVTMTPDEVSQELSKLC
jgi:lipopolysaccharide heptosyltransferase II